MSLPSPETYERYAPLDHMTPEAYLPAHLQGATIEKITAGLSGAGVYKVVAGDAA